MTGPAPIAPLEAYPLSKVWPDEALHFTPWLAQADNLARLGHTLGLGSLELEAREFAVGPFSLDILARDPLGHRVVVENHLEPSDHTHLGQLLTYAAGIDDLLSVVWVAASYRERHRAALAWLNAHTLEHIAFFGVAIAAWTIDGSGPGAQFNVVVRPDAQKRDSGRSSTDRPMTEEQLALQAYWSSFREFLESQRAQHWIRPDLPRSAWWGRNLGRPGFMLYAIVKPAAQSLGVQMEIDRHNEIFEALIAQRAPIEAEIGAPLSWVNRAVRHQIGTERTNVAINEKSSWPEQHAWLLDQLERFRMAFKDRIAALPDVSSDTDDER